ncbi:jg20782, partial [Pararge aegeria aegeria]
KHPDTEKHSCSSHKHSPVVGIEPTAMDSESRVAAHCATQPSNDDIQRVNENQNNTSQALDTLADPRDFVRELAD